MSKYDLHIVMNTLNNVKTIKTFAKFACLSIDGTYGFSEQEAVLVVDEISRRVIDTVEKAKSENAKLH